MESRAITNFESQFKERTGKDFNTFYKKYYSKMVWKIKSMNINQIDAEDISNRAFIQSLEKIHMYNPQYNYSTWVFDIAKKMAYQFMKDSAKIICVDTGTDCDSEDESYDPVQAYLASKINERQYFREDRTVTDLKYKETMSEIRKLEPKYKEIIELCDIEKLSYNQISERLGVNLQTVKNRIHHGRLKLERSLSKKFKYIEENY